MAWPNGVNLVTVTVGSALNFFGDAQDVTVEVTPIVGGAPARIIWAATAQPVIIGKKTFKGTAGAGATFTVPNPNQPGFIDGAGNAVTNWAYAVLVVAGGQRWNQTFQPTAGQTEIDLDLVKDGSITSTVYAPVPAVTSVNGATGDVTMDTATDENVAARIQSGPATQAALSAAIGEKSDVPSGATFVALGDSNSTPSGGGSQGSGWWIMAGILSEQRLYAVGNAAVAGDTSTQIAARVGDAIALGPKIVSVLAGTNDLHNGVTIEAWKNNIQVIVDALLAARIQPVLCTIPPRQSTTYLSEILRRNEWLTNYARERGIPVLDFFTICVDSATGAFADGMSVDDLHPSPAANVLMAQHMLDVLAPMLPTVPAPVTRTRAVNDIDMLLNPFFDIAGGWRTYTTATMGTAASIVTDPDFGGNTAIELAVTNPDGVYGRAQYFNTKFTPGDVLRVTGRYKMMSISADVMPAAGLAIQMVFHGAVQNVLYSVATMTSGVFCANVTVPDGATVGDLRVFANVGPTSSMTVRIGDMTLRNLSSPN